MLSFGIFGITNDSLNQGVSVLILVLIVIWAALVFWTYADARRRIDDPMLIGCATAASLFPFVGTIVYAIVRPPEFLDDVRLRELEMTAAEARLANLDYQLCPHCDYEVKGDYLRCPSCMRKLKDSCFSCGKPIDPAWKLCPYCEAETGATTRPPRAAGAGRETTDQPTVAPDAPPTSAAPGAPERKDLMERTLILVKPDAFARGLTGEIVARFERKGLKIVAMRHMQVTEDLAKQHYAEHDGKPFFGELVEFITSGPIVAMVLEGEQRSRPRAR